MTIDLVTLAITPVQVELIYELVSDHVVKQRQRGSEEPYLGDLEDSLELLKRCPC